MARKKLTESQKIASNTLLITWVVLVPLAVWNFHRHGVDIAWWWYVVGGLGVQGFLYNAWTSQAVTQKKMDD